jgi:outer membrane protein OmpA-like peptidoglycan-associated protein
VAVPEFDNQPVDRAPIGIAVLLLSVLAVIGLAALSFSGVFDDESPDAEVAGATEQTTVTTTTPTTAAPTTAAPTTAAPRTAAPATTAEPATTTTAAPATTTTPTTLPPATSEADAAAAVAALTGEGVTRTAVLSGGKVYLRGEVPTQDIADTIAGRVAQVVGPENVVVEYVINPDAPVPNSAPLYVEDKILFNVNSSDINPGFVPLLDLGTLLMTQRDTVTITVIAHTDSVGDADYNQALSDRRARAVKQFWIESGIDPSRIIAVGLGETQPEDSNLGANGRAANRRAEFIVEGILG